ncbi:MAG: class I SAM-dependent methyltransferase [Planctomycetota bacterium]
MRESVHDEYRRGGEHWWIRARRTIFATMLDEVLGVRAGAGARILDIGPGSGVNMPVLAPRGAVTVLDSDASSLAACREVGARAVVRADALHPPLADATFDLVCALDVLEHLEDDAGALAAWRRLLSPGGHLLLSVPAFAFLWGRQDVLSHHKRRYRRPDLVAKVSAAGFAVRRASYFNTLLFPPIAGARLLMRPFLRRLVARGTSDLAAPTPFGLDTALYRLFAAEAGWLSRRNLPVGVSILLVASAPR